ncbi:MAG: rodA [Ilumatobacteraceae bacterium]|jgi:rod shape determining protein RodA|nr:rodA [Ilumatobacteraceae bacterium]
MPTGLLQRKPDSGLGNIRSSPGSPGRNIDWVLLFAQSILSVAGLFVIYSASSTKFANPYLYVTRQEIFLITGFVTMAVVMFVDYDVWKRRATFFYGATIMLLVLVILLGTVNDGARLSFDIGPLKLQPAELAKVTTLLVLAAYLGDEERNDDGLPYARFVGGLVYIGVPVALIIVQPDLGSASVLIAMAMGVLLVAGARARYIALITILSAVTVAAAKVTGLINAYQWNRIVIFVNTDKCNSSKASSAVSDLCYQGTNAVKAIATGGITGKGWMKGPITLSKDIPVQWADFPFSAVGEQFGLVGCALLVGVFVIMLLRIWRIAHLSRDMFGTYVCAGVFTMLLWQLFQNVAMTIGVMPITGLPLPFISYGGSSLVAFCVMLGLVQNVHMRRYR